MRPSPAPGLDGQPAGGGRWLGWRARRLGRGPRPLASGARLAARAARPVLRGRGPPGCDARLLAVSADRGLGRCVRLPGWRASPPGRGGSPSWGAGGSRVWDAGGGPRWGAGTLGRAPEVGRWAAGALRRRRGGGLRLAGPDGLRRRGWGWGGLGGRDRSTGGLAAGGLFALGSSRLLSREIGGPPGRGSGGPLSGGSGGLLNRGSGGLPSLRIGGLLSRGGRADGGPNRVTRMGCRRVRLLARGAGLVLLPTVWVRRDCLPARVGRLIVRGARLRPRVGLARGPVQAR